jgi:hypothetical protein
MTRADQRKHHIIYKTTCLVTGKWYIGMHSTDDLNDGYTGSGQLLWKSVKKHGKEAHVCEILEHLPDRKSLSNREEEILSKELRADPLCMNLRSGGTGNYPGTPTKEETRAKISEVSTAMWAKRREEGYVAPPQSPTSVAKRAAKNTGKTRTPEQLANLAAGQQGYYSTVDPTTLTERAKKAAQTRVERGTNLGGRPKGIAMSDEQKARQSASTKGKSLSAEHKAALKTPKIKASCICCRAETTVGALSRYHSTCT